MKTFLDEIAEEIINSKHPFDSVKVIFKKRTGT